MDLSEKELVELEISCLKANLDLERRKSSQAIESVMSYTKSLENDDHFFNPKRESPYIIKEKW